MELLTVGGGCDGRGWEGWELYSGRSAQTWLLVYLSVCCFCLGLPRETKKRSFSSLQAGPPVLPVCVHFPQLCSTISYKIVLMLKWSSISVSIHLYFLTCFWPCNCTHKVFFEWPVTWMHVNCTCKDSPQLLLCLLLGGFVYKCKYVWLMSFSGGADKIRSRGLRNWV